MDELEPIKRRIYEIRSRRVMLDSDLADLYKVETKYLKRTVRANMERFPSDFMFELTKEEYDSLRCKNCTLNGRGQHSKYLPFAFTREGVAMLAGLLRSEVAVQANISIMRAFFQMQEALVIVGNTQLQLEQIRAEIDKLRTDLNDTLADQNDINEQTQAQLDAITVALIELQKQGKKPIQMPEIGYKASQKRREKKL